MFERSITIRDVAEPLVSFDAEHAADDVGSLMERRDFDVVGVREQGVIVGYVQRGDLKGGIVRDHQLKFQSGDVCADAESLISVFESLRRRDAIFVTMLGQIGGIVTRGDLQKAPVRMWIFGLISLIEMQMERIIRQNHEDDSWKSLLTESRLTAARKIFDERKRHNEEIDLTSCLQLADKGTVLSNDETFLRILRYESKSGLLSFFGRLEKLRNRLAHSQDIIRGAWPELADLLIEAESVLGCLEKAGVADQ